MYFTREQKRTISRRGNSGALGRMSRAAIRSFQPSGSPKPRAFDIAGLCQEMAWSIARDVTHRVARNAMHSGRVYSARRDTIAILAGVLLGVFVFVAVYPSQ